VLDLGCGLGGYSKVLAERGFHVSAFDVVREYVERACALGVPAELYPLRPLYRMLDRFGAANPHYYFRLRGRAPAV
jgi:hypothetical protein